MTDQLISSRPWTLLLICAFWPITSYKLPKCLANSKHKTRHRQRTYLNQPNCFNLLKININNFFAVNNNSKIWTFIFPSKILWKLVHFMQTLIFVFLLVLVGLGPCHGYHWNTGKNVSNCLMVLIVTERKYSQTFNKVLYLTV